MDVQGVLRRYVEETGGVGAAVGLIDRTGSNIFVYGKQTIRGSDPITGETLFEIGSITKVFTTLILAIMDGGAVHLDDPVERYLTGLTFHGCCGKKMTLRHLATHTSGLPGMPGNFNPQNPNNPYADYTVEDLQRCVSSCALQAIPGEKYEYSNLGMGLLGHILSTQAGQSYETLVRTVVCKQLQLDCTQISISSGGQNQFATGHCRGQVVEHWDIPTLAGAGALRSTIKDMTKFLAANMGFSDSPIVELARRCHEQQYALPSAERGTGLGWVVSHADNHEIIWHNGGTGGFRSFLGFNSKTQTGAVILSNSAEDWPDELGMILLDPDVKSPTVDLSLASSFEYLQKFVGMYEVSFGPDLPKEELRVSIYGKHLVCLFSSEDEIMLYPEQQTVFGIRGFFGGKVYCTLDGAGRAVAMRLSGSDGKTLWEAVSTNHHGGV